MTQNDILDIRSSPAVRQELQRIKRILARLYVSAAFMFAFGFAAEVANVLSDHDVSGTGENDIDRSRAGLLLACTNFIANTFSASSIACVLAFQYYVGRFTQVKDRSATSKGQSRTARNNA